MLDSGASRCFFRDSTTLTPLPAPVPVRLADTSGDPVVARSSTVLPCLAVLSGSLSVIHLPSFSTNLVLQRFGFLFSSPQPTPLSTSHSLSAPPSDESVEPSGLCPELVGCLIYLMTCTQPDLTYCLNLLDRYMAPVARYSSPATAALSRLMLPYLFPDLAAFATVADLITHLHSSDARYRAALPTELCAKNPSPHVHHPLLLSHPPP
ncbi:unnamed protein product [Closterium sp. NIES-53]